MRFDLLDIIFSSGTLFATYCLQGDFFIILHDILAEMEEVTELQPVPDAHVPVMKLKFCGISIDLLYASVSLLVVPQVNLLGRKLISASSSIMYLCHHVLIIFVQCHFACASL